MAKISVIIPAYNQGHYLAEAVDSVLQGTFQDFEILIIDDGSTDHTPQVAQGYTDARILYIRQENGGLSAARNTGLRHAQGEYITFLDSDDRFLLEKLTRLGSFLDAHPEVGFVAGQAILMDGDGKRLERMVGSRLPEDKAQLLLGNPLHVGSVLLRRTWLDQVDPFDESMRACEDWDLWLRLARQGCPMAWVAEPVSLYRVHGEQMTRDFQRMRKAMLTTLDKVYNPSPLLNLPPLPPGWLELKDKAYAGAYMKAAARAYHQGAYEDAQRDLAECLRLDPLYLENGAQRLADHLVGWATAPMVKDGLAYLDAVYSHLPENAAVLRSRRRKDLARLGVQLAFEARKQGDQAQARSLLRQAVGYQPFWLANRGVLSVLMKPVKSKQVYK